MKTAITLFQNNRLRILDLGTIYDVLIAKVPLIETQAEEILRAQVVLMVSAFDTFIHDCVRIGIVRQFTSTGLLSNSLKSYPIPFEDFQAINNIQTVADRATYLDGVIKKVNAKDSYQSPSSVEYALGLLGVTSMWTKLSPIMKMPASDIKAELANIVNRRNKIAHESDMDALGVLLNPISKVETMHVMGFLNDLALNIYKLVK